MQQAQCPATLLDPASKTIEAWSSDTRPSIASALGVALLPRIARNSVN